MTGGRTFSTSAIILAVLVGTSSCEPKQDQKQAAEKALKEGLAAAQRQLRRDELCKPVQKVETELVLLNRADLLGTAEPRKNTCDRLRSEGCLYKVEILYELNKAGKHEAAESIAKIGGDCAKELEFATKHGLPAFRDHITILESAVDEARDEGRSEAEEYPEPQDVEPPDYR